MGNVRAKVFDYAASLDRDGRISADDAGNPVELGQEWTPEHLLLAALLRCALASLRHYAEPRGIAVVGGGTATGTVTLREADGVFGLVQAEAHLDVQLTPAPSPEELPKLLARAKAGCFVSNSLSVHPTFNWRVNGADATPA